MNPPIVNERKRRKIFQRERDDTLPFIITDRDIEILSSVEEHRFLTIDHLRPLTDIPYKTLTRRLQKLFKKRYLDRPLNQLGSWIPKKGTKKIIYALAQGGADELTRQQRLPLSGIDWTEKNRQVGNQFIAHSLGINTLRTSLTLCCARAGLTMQEWRQWDGVKVDIPLPESEKPVRLVPDAYFLLEDEDDRMAFFLEWDNSSEPIVRTDLNLSSIRKKFTAYWHLWDDVIKHPSASILSKNFGVAHFRVLLITKSKERIANMVKLCKTFPNSHNLFWFTTQTNIGLDNPSWLTEPLWYPGGSALGTDGKITSPEQSLIT